MKTKNILNFIFCTFILVQTSHATTFITENGFKDVWLWQLSNTTVTQEKGISLAQNSTNYYKSSDTLWTGKFINDSIYIGTAETATLYKLDNNYQPTEVFSSSNHSLISAIIPDQNGLLIAVSPESCLVHLDSDHQVLSNTSLQNTYIWDIVPNPQGGFDILTGLSAEVYTYNNHELSPPLSIATEEHLLKGMYVNDTLWVLGEKGLYKKQNNQFIAIAMFEGDASSFVYTNGNFYIAHTVTVEENPANNQPETLISKLSSVSAQTGLIQELYSLQNFYFTSINIFGQQIVLGADQFYAFYDLVTKKSFFSSLGENKILDLFIKGSELIALTSESLWGIHNDISTEGSFISEVYDAGNTAVWGEFTSQISTPPNTSVQFFVQSGVTEDPTYWGDWVSITNHQKIPTPSSRYLRYKVVLASTDKTSVPYIHSVKFPYTQLNIPPTINNTKISYENKNIVFSWRATDANKDNLEYTIYLAEDGMPKVQLKKQSETNFVFPQANYPSGIKKITLVVSDRPSNSDQTALTSEFTSLPIMFDGESPVISDLDITKQNDKAIVKFSVSDKHSIIESASYIINGNKTVKLVPVDGIFDSKTEEFTFEITLDKATFLQVSVKDSHNNISSRGVTLLPEVK